MLTTLVQEVENQLAKILDSAGLFFAGSIDKIYTIFETNGIKYGS